MIWGLTEGAAEGGAGQRWEGRIKAEAIVIA